MFIKSYSLCNSGEVKFTKQTLTRGGKIFIAYLFIDYIFPLLINLFYDSNPIFRLPIYNTTVLFTLITLISVAIIAVIAARYAPTITPINRGPIKPLPISVIVIFSLIAIYVGYGIITSGLSGWRYIASESISDNSSLLYASVVQMLMPVLCFWVLITDHQLILSRSLPAMFVKGIMLLGVISSINGLGSAFFTLIFTLVFIAPKSTIGFLFKNSINTKTLKRFFSYSLLLLFLPILVLPIFLAGSFAKSGNFDLEASAIAHAGLNYLINRHSVHLSSAAASIEDGSNHSDLGIPFDTAAFRVKVLTGLDPNAKKPDISTFSRLALVQFADFRNINPKGGSSPGLLASLTMILPMPFAILSTFFVTFILVKFCDFILFRQPPFSWMGALVFAYLPFKFVTDSPIDLIIPGPPLIILLCVLLLSFRREKIS